MKATKKSLAFLLALVMMLTLIPASAFAATTNNVSAVPVVAKDEVMPTTVLQLKVRDSVQSWSTEQKVKITLENADWAVDFKQANLTAGAITSAQAFGAEIDGTGSVDDVVYNSKGTATMSVSGLANDDVILLYLNLKSGKSAGEIKVKLESIDGNISGGTYTVATIAGGDTVARVVDDPTNIGERSVPTSTAAIEIQEASVNAVAGGRQAIKLTLPKDFEWTAGTLITGDMISGGAVGAVDDSTYYNDSVVVLSGHPEGAYVYNSGRDLIVVFEANDTPSSRSFLTIEPEIKATKGAKLGDISVQLRVLDGDITKESSLIIGKLVEEGVIVSTVDEADLPTIVAGFEKDGDSAFYTVEVTLEETVDNSFIGGRYVDITFPEWVQIPSGAGVDVDFEVECDTTGVTETLAYFNVDPQTGDIEDDTSSIEFLVPNVFNANGEKDSVTFTIPVTVEAGHEGELEVTVSGAKAGVDEQTIVVANIVKPITAEVKLADLRTGVQNQKGGEIILTETEAGLIREDKDITLSIDDLDLAGRGMQFKDATVEVIGGDLEIDEDNVDVDNGVIVIPVDRSSIKEAAEIKISNVEITLDRTLPEGKYDVRVRGEAVVDNGMYRDAKTGTLDGKFTNNAASAEYVNIITQADGNIYGTATFKIGERGYSVLINGELEKFEMDTAAFTQDQRTMIPVKYVMLALGGTESDVIWNDAAQTATFFKGDRVCVIKIGSNVMTVNGAEVYMDTAAFVKDQRTFVPLKYVATALGCTVEWDAATETVTVNQ